MDLLAGLAIVAAIIAFLVICAFSVVGVILIFGDMTWTEFKEEQKKINNDVKGNK